MEEQNAIMLSSDRLMEFAEVLYKCTLCTTLPSILTSKVNFLNHMNDSHVGTKASLCGCRECNLKFDLEEDLKAHMESTHPSVVTQDGSSDHKSVDTGHFRNAHFLGNGAISFDCDNEDFVNTSDQDNVSMLSFKSVQVIMKGAEEDNVITDKTQPGIMRRNQISPNSVLCRSKRKRSVPVAHRENHSKTEKLIFPQKFLNFQTDPADAVTNSYTSKRPMLDTDLSISQNDLHSLNNWKINPPPHQSLKMKFQKRETKSDSAQKSVYTCMNMYDGVERKSEDTRQVDNETDLKDNSGANGLLNFEEQGIDNRGKSRVIPNLDHIFGHTKTDKDIKPQSLSAGTFLAPNTVSNTALHQCSHCSYKFSDFCDYANHCAEVHEVLEMTLPDCQQVSMGEGEKANKIKEHLPALLCSCPGNCVSRDILLEQLSERIPKEDILQWGPACNKAVREIFSNSQAVRKGKYKRTFYLGVKLLSGPPTSGDLEMEEEEEATSNMVLRDMSQHTELITQVLPEMVRWTGHMDSCMTRDSLLHTISVRCGDPDILSWGVECNRAVRQLFPAMYLKRKGKYKTTCFYGMELVSKPPCEYLNEGNQVASRGPPVVNAMDIVEAPGPAHFSKLKPPDPSQQTHHQSLLEQTRSDWIGKAELTNQHHTDQGHVISKDGPSDAEPNYDKGTTCPQKAVSPSPSILPLPNSPDANPRSLEKLILLHPGPFILARIINRRFQRCVPHINLVINAMTLLQSYGLGQVFTVMHGNSKVFFKALPSRSIEPSLSLLGVRLTDYQVMFRERDPKLEDYTHDKVKLHYPELHLLPAFYKY